MKLNLLAILLLISHLAVSQQLPKNREQALKQVNSKPKQFSKLPRGVEGRLQGATDATVGLNKAFQSAKVGDMVEIPIAANQVLKGIVLLKKETHPGVTVMRLHVANYEGAEMYAVQREDNGSKRYFSTVHHVKYSDALVLKGAYFVPENQTNLIIE
jgi:hypothetical protein